MIITNPFADLLRVPSRPSSVRPVEGEALRTHQALEQAVAALQALLAEPDPRQGPKAWEFHQGVQLTGGTAVAIKHNLGRVPRWFFIGYISEARVLSYQREQWTADQFVITAGAGSPIVDGILI